jgi:Fe-S oxidoreductase
MGGAVDMCSGLGVCRKTLDGTMCPSYMATREEAHSTRGRANVLRLAMAGRLGEAGLGDDGVRGVMDLCLECRACKAECPVGVDVARFKGEFLADYWRRHGTPIGTRALGHVHRLAKWGSRSAPLSNRVAASSPVRWLTERVLGIDRRRTLPAWSRRTFSSVFRQHQEPGAPGRCVHLFRDTFTEYFTPEIGQAAQRVLERTGFNVGLAPNVCCGRPLISQGLLEPARKQAELNARALYSHDPAPCPVVFLEPSCLSAVREDAPALLRGELREQALQLANRSVLFEELIGREGTAALRLGAGPRAVLLHGHCHQKAMGLLAPAVDLLSRIPGARVVDLDAGCCGMAGSFGYRHFDLSRQIGERRLFPAVRERDKDAVVVASGVSCRHQLSDFTGARALHPAELLLSLLPETP